jgi:hypothetical protein
MLNQLSFFASKLANQLIRAPIPLAATSSDPLSSTISSKYLKNAQADLENASVSKFIHWHLFKGGVRTSTSD